MRTQTLRDAICPKCLSLQGNVQKLEVSDLVPPNTLENSQEITEAVLICRQCKSEYPVIAGVLVAVPDVREYFSRQFNFIISVCEAHQAISNRMRNYLLNKRYNLAKEEDATILRLAEEIEHIYHGSL